MNICVFGASSTSLDSIYYEESELLGKKLAENGHALVFGGGNGGLMGSVARGVHQGNGNIIGIAPSFFDKPGILFQNCTELILTETMRERKQLMDEKSDAIIVLPGGIGTFEEFFEMLTLKQLGETSKAIIIYNINNYFDPMINLLKHVAAENFMSDNCFSLFIETNNADSAIDYLNSYIPLSGNLDRLENYSK